METKLMEISDKGLALIKEYEGFNAVKYMCPAGYPTIGYGHVILPEESAKYAKVSLTEAEATTLLKEDVAKTYGAIYKLVTVPISQGQFDALCSFIFNLGAGAFQRSTLLELLNRGSYAGAANEFSKWVWATVRGKKTALPGLVRRRQAEQRLFLS